MSKYIVISLLVLGFLSPQAYGQDKKKSKYQSISKRNLKMDQSVPVLLHDAEQIMITDTEGALDKVEEALALSITQKSIFNEANCYLLLGRINQKITEWELAVENYQNALQRLESSYRLTPEFVQTLTGLSQSYASLGKYDLALEPLFTKLEVIDESNQIAETQLEIADVQYYQGSIESAVASLDKAELIINKAGLKQLKIRSQTIKAKILAQSGDIDAAEDLYQESQIADDLFLEGNNFDVNEESFEVSKEELINAYQKQDLIEEEINLRNQSIASNIDKGNSLKVVKEKQELSKRFIQTGKTSAAIKELEEAVQLADSLSNDQELAKAYRSLAQAWDGAGNSEQSLIYYRQYATSMDKVRESSIVNKEKKDVILKKQQDISSLTKELALDESEFELEKTSSELRANQLSLQRFIIYALLVLLLIVLIASGFIYRGAKRSRMQGQLLALKSLRGQMNPHFIFNALNSVNQFIALNDERAANKFISEFSKLMRLVLDNSQYDFITLADEKEMIALYLKLEHNRFRDKFDYELYIDEQLSLETIEIPPMLIQPYIENAIWHGLRYKEEKGHLEVRLTLNNQELWIEIIDDGIGREKSKSLKTVHQKKHISTGLKNTQERISIINKVYGKCYAVLVTDLNGVDSGTQVKLTLPQNGKG